MALQWYTLRSKPRKEEAVWRQLTTRGIEVFYPRIRVKPINPRARTILPYFPGYMFIHVDLEEAGVSTFQWMTHTAGLVSFGGEPATVPEGLIVAICKRVEDLDVSAGNNPVENMHSGDKIRIQYGPFKGYEAIFDTRVSGTERVRVLLELLNDRLVLIELDGSVVERT
jgi:transcription antitermination factor NusG